jgi:hypothetical protein
MTKETAFNKICRVSEAYQETCLLIAAAELDLFTAILEHKNKISAQKIAEICQTNLRGTIVLLDALAATGYLVKSVTESSVTESSVTEYSVAEEWKELLDSRCSTTYIPMIRHRANVHRSWTQLARTVKTGMFAETPPSILGAEQDRVSFIWAMNSVARVLVEPMIKSLRKSGLLSFETFLDIGGASGTYSQAFLQALPNSKGTIFDLPVGIEAARKRFIGSEFEHRVQLIEGDIFRNEFPTGFDFAWISAIIHQFNRSESRELYKKTFKALKSGGTIAVRDFMMNVDRTSPKDGAFFGINMLVETPTGMVYTFDEVKEDLESAGFANIKLAIPAETMSSVVAATKP